MCARAVTMPLSLVGHTTRRLWNYPRLCHGAELNSMQHARTKPIYTVVETGALSWRETWCAICVNTWTHCTLTVACLSLCLRQRHGKLYLGPYSNKTTISLLITRICGTAVKMLHWDRESRKYIIYVGLPATCDANFDRGSGPKIFLPGGPGPHTYATLATRVSCGMTCHSGQWLKYSALVWQTGWQTDHTTTYYLPQ